MADELGLEKIIEEMRQYRQQLSVRLARLDECLHRLSAPLDEPPSGALAGYRSLSTAILHILNALECPLSIEDIHIELKGGGFPLATEKKQYATLGERQLRDIKNAVSLFDETTGKKQKIKPTLKTIDGRVGLVDWPSEKWG